MRKLSELQQEIESVRFELDQALLRQDKFDNYYQKSTKLDQLIEEYIEETERSKQRRMENNAKSGNYWSGIIFLYQNIDFFLRVG